MSEKRLFFRDPSTGTEMPLQVYKINSNTVSSLSVNKQDKEDSGLDTSVKTIVGSINEINGKISDSIKEPYVKPQLGGANGFIINKLGWK